LFVTTIIADVPLNIMGPEAGCPDVAVPALTIDGGAELS
jgi:hypothetical protein